MHGTVIPREPSFDYFTMFPTELRLEIWSYCLPSRIVEVHDALYDSPLPGMPLDLHQKVVAQLLRSLPLAPPIISKVCRESRYVALRHGGLWPIGLKHARAWFDKRTDSISFDPKCASISFLRCKNNVRRGDISSTLRGFLSDTTIPLCIGNQLVECAIERLTLFRGRQKGRNKVAQWAMECIAKRTECTVILQKVALHLNHQDACGCGLFGLFAESSPAHINAQDVRRR